MKLMIASDIHGSSYYLEKLLCRFNEEKPDKLILLGDILYHGPRNDLPEGYNPKKVIELLNNIKEKLMCVRGNCDTEVDQMVLEFPILADYALLYHESKLIFITHGHNYNTKNPPLLSEGDILLHGHTHVPTAEKCESFTYINPGSVSIPKEDSPHSYMMFEGGTFTWKDLDGKKYMEFNM